jgi:hypothetical protein
MITLTKEQAQQVLDAMARVNVVDDDCDILAPSLADAVSDSIDIMRQALSQPEAEPVAWLYPDGLAALKTNKCWTAYPSKHDECTIPLYTRPTTDEALLRECLDFIATHAPYNTYGSQPLTSKLRARLGVV